jgi:hypothetical protein
MCEMGMIGFTGVTVISNKSGFSRVLKYERLGRAVTADAQLL